LLVDGAAQPAVNMAVDEALLREVSVRRCPVLRLYRWARPACSLGWFQPYPEGAIAGGVPIVRRMTGGRAILHDRETTLSLILPADDPHLHLPVIGLVGKVHRAVLRALARMGVEGQLQEEQPTGTHPFFCYARSGRMDVVVGGRKIFGSAQRRTRQGLLLHGSFMEGYHPLNQGTSLDRLLERLPSYLQMEESLRLGFEEVFSCTLKRDVLRPSEEAWRDRLVDRRYATEAWNRHRRRDLPVGKSA
jgi:lipoate-protein ligase A